MQNGSDLGIAILSTFMVKHQIEKKKNRILGLQDNDGN